MDPMTSPSPNPSPKQQCVAEGCRHPRPFHTKDGPCRAFACSCEKFVGDAKMKAETKPPKLSEPRTLAEALERGYPNLEKDLRDTKLGHKAVADRYPFTSESSVRRWRTREQVKI